MVTLSPKKWEQFISYIVKEGDEFALAPSLASGLYIYGKAGQPSTEWLCYQDNTAPIMITAKAGFSTYDMALDSGAGWEMSPRHGSVGAYTGPAYFINGTYTMDLLPKTQAAGTNVASVPSLGFFRWLIAKTGLNATRINNFANAFQRGHINLNLAYQKTSPKEMIRGAYFNDLMNHRQPFGPTSRRK